MAFLTLTDPKRSLKGVTSDKRLRAAYEHGGRKVVEIESQQAAYVTLNPRTLI